MTDPRAIDLRHLGRERVICCWQVGDALVDPGPSSCLDALLEALDGWEPKRLLLTHIHLDHAGASGTLVERWPDLQVHVHERGAPHMRAPDRLYESARKLYGDEMEHLWGEMRPVPEENLHALAGGEELEGGWEVAATPGHASHHVAYRHEGWAFVGDVAGVRIPPAGLALPPTPPPDVDLGAWHRSLGLVAAWQPEQIALTHFGAFSDVEHHLDQLGRRLDAYGALVRDRPPADFFARLSEEVARATGDDLDTAAAYTQAAPPEQQHAGLARYWAKQA